MKNKKQIPDLDNPIIDETSQCEEESIAQDTLEKTKITPTDRFISQYEERIIELKETNSKLTEENISLKAEHQELLSKNYDLGVNNEVLKEKSKNLVQNMGISAFLVSGGGGFLALSQSVIGGTFLVIGIVLTALMVIKEYFKI